MPEKSIILPENGSVVVIDDRFEEALPIIRTFARESIPVTFYHGYKADDLPISPKQIVRIVIADLQLYEGQTDGSVIAKGLINILQQIIGPENGPYILLAWSKKETLFLQDLKSEISKLTTWVRPVFIASLKKSDCLKRLIKKADNSEIVERIIKELSGFDEDDLKNIRNVIESNLDDSEETIFEATDDALEKIETRLKEELIKQGVFHLFMIWENLVKRSGAKLVKELSSLMTLDEYWEPNMRNILKRMGIAMLGQNPTDREGMIRASLSTMGSSFSDTLDLEIKESHFPPSIDYTSEYLMQRKTATNTFALKEENKKKNFLKDGNLLYQEGDDWRKILGSMQKAIANGNAKKITHQDHNDCFDLFSKYDSIPYALNTQIHIETNPTQDLMPGNIYFIDNLLPAKKTKYLETYIKSISKPIEEYQLIELEVSPVCDYAQTKWKRSRTLPGLLYPVGETCRSGKNFYIDGPIFEYKGKAYSMIFDFHLFNALDKDHAQKRDVKFRLKRELLLDIVAQLSAHVNRPGITTVE